jgi:UDP-N-acetylmuramoyl-tripeptide--D-alanyl-D-alanine ligase
MSWDVGKIVSGSGGVLLYGSPETPITEIATDSRRLRPGACFVALEGERFDGHDFIRGAIETGVSAVVVGQNKLPALNLQFTGGTAVIAVRDTLHALGELACAHRLCFSIPVIGIGGSNGKTSSKEMVARILGQHRTVLKNPGNLNNLIGVPLTLLSLEMRHEAAVVEMGINVPGEMGRLVEVCRPTVGLLTNIHPAHLEGLGSLDQILEEKGKLLTRLGPQDLAVVNADDELISKLSKRLEARILTFSSTDSRADVRLSGPVRFSEGFSTFSLTLGAETHSIRLPVLGVHQVHNAVGAAAVAWGVGEPVESIVTGLSQHQPVQQRMQLHRLSSERVLVDDTYNANPRSMLAALETVLSTSEDRPVVAILGDMRELGVESVAMHRHVGEAIGKTKLRRLITLGEMGHEIGEGATGSGLSSSAWIHVPTHEAAVEWVRDHCPKGAWILVKGSRGMTMERIVQGILSLT